MKHFFTGIFILLYGSVLIAKDLPSPVMSLAEYLSYVKAYHPIVKQANLIIDESDATLLKARGAFDPKIEIDYDTKEFKNTEYYDKLNAAFKVPTWYGIELKAGFEENEGIFLNPEANVPENGLYNVGVSVALARGFLINKRMAMLKQAKLFTQQAQADRQLLVNTILYDALRAYFNWLRAYNEQQVYDSFLTNAALRFDGIKTSYEAGERPAVDTLEARITLYNRKLSLEKARITYIKASLEASNFLWLNNNTPIEIQDAIIPDTNTFEYIDDVLNIAPLRSENFMLKEHPKLRSLEYKYQGLFVEKRLKANQLLPRIDVQYNFLSQNPDVARSFATSAYKGLITVRFPLFLRKERGDLQLAKLKLQDTQLEINATEITLKNKINALIRELESFMLQNDMTIAIISDYEALLKAEERKFTLGESSLFLINSRESNLIDAKLKAITLENDYFNTKANLFNVLSPEMP